MRSKRIKNENVFTVVDDVFGREGSQEHSILWWMFILPGRVILWFGYMFPRGVGGVFGSARRRKSPVIEISYSITFYLVFIIILSFSIMKFLNRLS
jgi:hypothetical protein